jgi:hypothetical protein
MKPKIAVLLAGAHPRAGNLRGVYVLSLAPHRKEVALAELDLWSNLTVQFHGAAQQANTEVRVGYFGLCARLMDTSGWECMENGDSLFKRLGPDTTDALNIVRLADNFKSDVMFPGLVSVVDLTTMNANIANVCVALVQWLYQSYALLG